MVEKNQKTPYAIQHDYDYLRITNYIKPRQKTNYENVKIIDIFYDEKTKITEDLIKETEFSDPVLHKIKMWKKHNKKPHSVTKDIRGNKGLFAYFREFESIKIDEKSGLNIIIIKLHKNSIIKICLPLTLLLSAFNENN